MDYSRRKMARGEVPNKGTALDCLYVGLQGKDCCSAKQKTWIVRRVADLKGWALPKSVPHFSAEQEELNMNNSGKKKNEIRRALPYSARNASECVS